MKWIYFFGCFVATVFGGIALPTDTNLGAPVIAVAAFGIAFVLGLRYIRLNPAESRLRATVGLSIFAVIWILVGMNLMPVLLSRKTIQWNNMICLLNLRQMSRANSMYATDFDDRMPSAAEWMDQIDPYCNNKRFFNCPSVPRFGYAFNKPLGDQNATHVESPETTPLLYDSTTIMRNANDAFTSLPRPARHEGGKDSVAYADGHARAVSP
jgi:hypothetical protein